MEKTIFYSDKIVVSESENGFILNFLKDKSDIEELIDYGFRIGLSPISIKEFLYVLMSAIGEYEQKYGEIKVGSDVVQKIILKKPAPIGFQYPNKQ